MNEEFDDRLKSHITDIFDHYEDDSAHGGWLLLREKYPAKKERSPALWLWWGSAAAILLVILGLGIWLNGNAPVKQNLAYAEKKTSPIIPVVSEGNKTHVDYPSAGKATRTATTPANRTQSLNPTTQNTSIINSLKNNAAPLIAKRQTEQHPNKINNAGEQPLARNADMNKTPAKVNELADTKTEQGIAKPSTAKKSADSSVLVANTSNNTLSTTPTMVAKPVIKEPVKPLFTAKNPSEPPIKKQADKTVKFGVYAATYFNYAKGSDNEFNVGAGFSSEIKLVGRLKLLTGIAINQNSFNYTSTIPQVANGYLAYNLARAGVSQGPANALVNIAGASFASTAPIVKNYQASLIGLDIPVNLKYQFSKNDTYIAAGLSSGTYINESYQYVYNYPATTSALVGNESLHDTKTQNFFNTFDFARTLNVSFGMGYPLGKKNRLIIEPFLKYPLDGLGSQQIKFGAGGVNLKLNFQPAKK